MCKAINKHPRKEAGAGERGTKSARGRKVSRSAGSKEGAAQGLHCAAWPLPLGPAAGPLRELGSAEPDSEEDNTAIEQIYS